jgi:uncharacterized protein involved in exopolysaccharide biosynthesis
VNSKLLEAFFRHKLLLLAPPILLPLVLGPLGLVLTPPYYESVAGIWTERPAYLLPNDAATNYISPAQTQTTRMTELLHTRSFELDVARRTPLAPLVGSPRGETAIDQILTRGLALSPRGNNLLVISFRADTADLSYKVVDAVLQAFRDKASTDQMDQATLAISFYEGRLRDAQDQYTKSNDALRRYLAAHPGLANATTAADLTSGGSARALGASRVTALVSSDPQLALLENQGQLDQQAVERARSALDQAQLDVSASLQGQEVGFQLIDPPIMPTSPSHDLRKTLVFPLAGLVLGLALSATLLVLLVSGDRTARAQGDLMGNLHVVGVIPLFARKSLPKTMTGVTSRQMIGFVAGAALPAPSRGE